MSIMKDHRIAVRLSSEQDSLIRQAAEVEGSTVTDFTVAATIAHAKDVLADRRLFVLNDVQWADFTAILDRPVSHKPRLERVFDAASIVE